MCGVRTEQYLPGPQHGEEGRGEHCAVGRPIELWHVKASGSGAQPTKLIERDGAPRVPAGTKPSGAYQQLADPEVGSGIREAPDSVSVCDGGAVAGESGGATAMSK